MMGAAFESQNKPAKIHHTVQSYLSCLNVTKIGKRLTATLDTLEDAIKIRDDMV